jgi:hypothetical protein
MTPPVLSLKDNLVVKALDADQVTVTVTLPAHLVQSYCLFLDSLAEFFRVAGHRSTVALAQERVKTGELDRQANSNIEAYRRRIVASFDAYTSQGLNRQDAIQRISAELRIERHPWRSPEAVRATLVEAGRSGRPGRPRRGES